MLDEGPFLPKRSCSPSRLLEPSGAGRADPSPAWSTAPQRGQRAERLHSRKSSEAGHEGFEDPSSGFWLQTPRHTLGRGSGGLFPLAEPEIQQALVWHEGSKTCLPEATARPSPGPHECGGAGPALGALEGAAWPDGKEHGARCPDNRAAPQGDRYTDICAAPRTAQSGAPTHTDLPALAPSLHLRKVLERQQPSVSPSPGCPALFQACHF
ncbi:unnamed protein product [Rangifer tarandus platyrhynchus]|uniref:Uncharacterized protein n=1 Tax=Rangifer tarandus platyrhynchus TaxID=3082113 RepID=A0AC59ZVP1_RANTA